MAKAKAKGDIDTRHYDVIVAPHITEKSTLLSENNAVVFKVDFRVVDGCKKCSEHHGGCSLHIIIKGANFILVFVQ